MDYHFFKKKLLQITHRKPYFYIIICLAASAILLDLFIEITESTLLKYEMIHLDAFIIHIIQQFVTPNLTIWVLLITDSGSAKFYLIACSLLFLYWIIRRSLIKAFILISCLGGAGILNFLLKHLFERNRPDIYRVITETGYSFPSGHAMGALCFYGIVAFFFSLRFSNPIFKLLIALLTTFYILLIGLSRIYLGVHYPSDVLAGYIAGSTWLFFCIFLYLILYKKKKI